MFCKNYLISIYINDIKEASCLIFVYQITGLEIMTLLKC